jgi:beta-amylase
MKSIILSLAFAHVAMAKIPVFVMLPLDTITSSMTVKDTDKLKSYFQQLKNAKVEGVMSDCWWGLVEQSEGKYNFDPYVQLTQMAKDAGLKMEFVLSFHRCGGNVGDDCNIPLPQWVINSSSNIWYRDREGRTDTEYISLFADNEQVLGSARRSAIKVYGDFMAAFKSALGDFKQ